MFSESKHIDREKNPPTIIGPHGAAWKLDLAAVRAAFGCDEKRDGSVCLWIVFAPWANMAWSYYTISAIHLRSVEGLPPAKINLAGATHEVVVAAMDPRVAPSLTGSPRSWLSPLNFMGQWVVNERPNPVDLDRTAAARIEEIVREILDGRLNPDTDFRHEWVRRFSDSNLIS